MTFAYLDSISIATSHVLDWDVPANLLPLIITNEAAQLAGLDSDRLGTPAWN
jgi:hypothetical protein